MSAGVDRAPVSAHVWPLREAVIVIRGVLRMGQPIPGDAHMVELKVGDRVRITGGKLVAFEGVIVELSESSAEVELNVFGRNGIFTISRDLLEMVDGPAG